MSENIDLCQKVERACYLVEVFESGKLTDTGSAIAVSENGLLLTAAHNFTGGRLPVKTSDLGDSSISIQCKTSHSKRIPYRVGVCGLSIVTPYLRTPLTVDLAVLHPNEHREGVEYFEIDLSDAEVGTPVLMAGFPDEVELPFSFDRLFNWSHPDLEGIRPDVSTTITSGLGHQIMIKSGMIGHVMGYDFTDANSEQPDIEGKIYYVDNSMHPGASGGPVVSLAGKLISIIVQRAVTITKFFDSEDLSDPNTKQNMLDVPSGSTVSVSARTIAPFL